MVAVVSGLFSVDVQALSTVNAFVRDRQLQMLSVRRQYQDARARRAADAGDVKEFIERERALWTENSKLREFAEINYTAFYKVREVSTQAKLDAKLLKIEACRLANLTLCPETALIVHNSPLKARPHCVCLHVDISMSAYVCLGLGHAAGCTDHEEA